MKNDASLKFQLKNMKHLLFISFLILTIISGCKKNSNEDKETKNRENILSDKSHIVDTAAISSVTSSALVLNKLKLNFEPAVGDIILASPSIGNPKGVIAKIVSLTTNGNNLNCNIQSSNLNEAFRQLYIDHKYIKDYSANAQLRGSFLGIPFPQNYQLTAGFTVNGDLKLNIPDVEIIYSKKDGTILPDTVQIVANINTFGSTIDMKANGSLTVPEKTLTTFNNLPIIEVIVPVGGIPLIIPFRQYVDINTLPLSINGKMKFTINPEISATLGFSYIKGSWTNLSNYSIGASAQKPIKTDFDANIQANITFFNPVYNIAPLWASNLSAFFKVPNEIEGKIQTQSPNYSLKYKLGIDIGVRYDFWLGISGVKSFNIPVYSTTIEEGNFLYNIGDTAFGGIIFYLDTSRVHGLVCALSDQGVAQTWGPQSICISGASTLYTSAFGTGSSNTNGIYNTGVLFNAVSLCYNYNNGTFTDWFLPSKDELNQLYGVLNLVHGLSPTKYWTSSYATDCHVWAQDFNSGLQSNFYPNGITQCNVRAVRKF